MDGFFFKLYFFNAITSLLYRNSLKKKKKTICSNNDTMSYGNKLPLVLFGRIITKRRFIRVLLSNVMCLNNIFIRNVVSSKNVCSNVFKSTYRMCLNTLCHNTRVSKVRPAL